MIAIKAQGVKVKYAEKEVLKGIDININDGEITTIIGPNGSGKTTLIKALSRCLVSYSGSVYLYGKDINKIKTKEIAKKMAILPQIRNISSDITVEALVAHGRFPHLNFRQSLQKEDKDIILWAIEKTGMTHLMKQEVFTLSGGEKQRAWIAMTLCQKTKILILDEPTTFLDISYQLEILELIKELNESLNLTVIMILHDLNQAARYSDKIYVLDKGNIFNWGSPNEIFKSDLIRDVFRVESHIYEDSVNDCLYFIPEKRA